MISEILASDHQRVKKTNLGIGSLRLNRNFIRVTSGVVEKLLSFKGHLVDFFS